MKKEILVQANKLLPKDGGYDTFLDGVKLY